MPVDLNRVSKESQVSTPQAGIFDRSYQYHLFFELSLGSGRDEQAIRRALAALNALKSEQTPVILALGPELWSRLDTRFSFPPFSLEGHVPATQGDLWVWVQGKSRSDVFDTGLKVRDLVDEVFSAQLELNGFVYHDMRDLTGFVDGIGNPSGEKAEKATFIAEPHPGAGGSWLLTQKWVHNLKAFNELGVPDQEKVFGRTKVDAVEFSPEDMPEDSHVGRTDVDRDGVPQKMWRRSVPYGDTTEHGLYFVAFACELDRHDYLLRRMYGIADDTVRDRLLDFSRPVMSSWWYVPTQAWIDGVSE
ncbi:Dyp-type peroxidase [Alcanivorax profundi]|uniref:Dyp-type peroxidase n=1 Tax=Alcanivorax profundi TaxID=2338368 RepID=A0A418Y2S2_9GAMM|nr:Dyp-type peroxidase [Alcanivorax profundi]